MELKENKYETNCLEFIIFPNERTNFDSGPVKTKVIDDGGSGMFKAIAVKEEGLPDFVIYRPKDFMYTHARQGAVPILLFGNGGCSDTSIGYERMLTEIASHGYVVVAVGEMQDKRNDRPERHTASSELKRGLDWIVEQSRTKGSDYYQNVDPNKVAAAGHSCGGAPGACQCGRPSSEDISDAERGDGRYGDGRSQQGVVAQCPLRSHTLCCWRPEGRGLRECSDGLHQNPPCAGGTRQSSSLRTRRYLP